MHSKHRRKTCNSSKTVDFLGFGYLYKFAMYYFFFFFGKKKKKADNNTLKKTSWLKCCNFFFFLPKIGLVEPVDQQINLVSPNHLLSSNVALGQAETDKLNIIMALYGKQ